MKKLITFRLQLTPLLLQLVFWLGSLACIAFGLIDIISNHRYLMGVQFIILGPLALRIITECLLVPFQIVDRLDSIIQKKDDLG